MRMPFPPGMGAVQAPTPSHRPLPPSPPWRFECEIVTEDPFWISIPSPPLRAGAVVPKPVKNAFRPSPAITVESERLNAELLTRITGCELGYAWANEPPTIATCEEFSMSNAARPFVVKHESMKTSPAQSLMPSAAGAVE